MEYELVTHEAFVNKNAQDYINTMKENFTSETNFFDNIKYLKDLNKEELEAFNLFKDKCMIDLRSRNKSSANTNHERAQFFNDKKIYHHHLINIEKYLSSVGTRFKNGKEETFIVSKEVKNINDKIEYNYHTSGLCIHYQKIEEEKTIYYKVLFVSVHPTSKEWTDTRDFIKETEIHTASLNNLGEKNEK